MSSIEEFWKAVNNSQRQKPVVIEYRVYYKDTRILYMISSPKGGQWPPGDSIVISKKMYKELRIDRYRVIDGKLVQVVVQDPRKLQLKLVKDGTFTSLPNNIIFAVKKGDNYKQREYIEVL